MRWLLIVQALIWTLVIWDLIVLFLERNTKEEHWYYGS